MPTDQKIGSMRNTVMSALHWSAIGKFSSQLITWTITIVIIRILDPSDFGLMAMATLVISIFATFEGLGLTASLVQKESLANGDIERIFGAIVLLGIILYSLIYLVAPLVALFFEESRLTSIIRVLATTIPILSLGALPLAMLRREMKFRAKSAVDFVAAISGSLCALAFAVNGMGVWALVAGSVCLSTLQSTGYWMMHRKLHGLRLDLLAILPEVKFGGLVTLDRLVWLFYSQADIFFIGKFMGKETLGVYAAALQVASLPMQKIVGILNEVGFSAFSRIQSNKDEIIQSLAKAVRCLSIAAFPVFLGISAVAPQVVDTLLGDDWAGVTAPLTLLALAIPFRLVNSTTPTLLFALGRADMAVQNSLVAMIVLAPAFAVTALGGSITHVCLVWVIGYPAYHLFCAGRLLPLIGMPMRSYLREMRLWAFAAVVMWLSLAVVQEQLGYLAPNDVVLLASKILAGAAIYMAIVWLLGRDRLVEFLRLLRNRQPSE